MKPCLTSGCPEVVPRGESRCPRHHRPRTSSALRYGNRWKRIRGRALRRDKHRCVKCGTQTRLQVDHVVPVVEGGGNELGNLQTLCEPCHTDKTRADRKRVADG